MFIYDTHEVVETFCILVWLDISAEEISNIKYVL